MSSPGSTVRERILEAADAVARDAGAAHLTLDHVAERAHVSKGGLLYHFATKDELLRAMIERSLERYRELLKRLEHECGGEYADYLRASMLARRDCDEGAECSRALFAGAAHDPTLLQQARAEAKAHFDRLRRDPQKFAQAVMLSLAIDGLHFLELMQLSPLTAEERAQVLEYLVAQAARL